jgi:MFS family permease
VVQIARIVSLLNTLVPPGSKNLNDQSEQEHFSSDVIFMLAIAGLGFMVDVYDLAMFGVVRIKSLTSLGVSGPELLPAGVALLNWQMAGMALGGLLWGPLGDKHGRRSILLGSILLYSIANIANAFVNSFEAYAVTRFFAGIGLAGEVGAAMTIAAEVTPRKFRAYGTAAVATFSTLGAVLATYCGQILPWRTAYLTAGAAGIALLLARFSLKETGFFLQMKTESIERGSLRVLFSSRSRLFRLLRCVLAAAPIWFAIAVLVSFGPEIADHGATTTITVASCIFFSSIGESLGECFSGVVSQLMHSRRRAMYSFLAAGAACVLLLLNSPKDFYAPLCLPMLFFFGYWSVAMTTTAEQFGTNLRATATSLVPNLVRGSAIPMTSLFSLLSQNIGARNSAIVTGTCCFIAAAISIHFMEETEGKELDFLET